MININNEIKLNELEYNIFQILLNTIKYQNKNTILRAAGGWVRDKVIIIILFLIILYSFFIII